MHRKFPPYLGNNCNKLRFSDLCQYKGHQKWSFPDALGQGGSVGEGMNLDGLGLGGYTQIQVCFMHDRPLQRLNAFQFDPQFNSLIYANIGRVLLLKAQQIFIQLLIFSLLLIHCCKTLFLSYLLSRRTLAALNFKVFPQPPYKLSFNDHKRGWAVVEFV